MLVTTDSYNSSNARQYAALARLALYPLAGLAVAVSAWRLKRKQRIALQWPSVDGTVQSVNMTPGASNDHSVTLTYSYYVGQYRSGEYVQDFPSEYTANEFAEAMKDKKVPIRYNPLAPDDSVLEPEDVQEISPSKSYFG